MESIRLDKTVCKAQSFEEAEKNKLFGKEVPVADRLKLAFHLSCTIHGIKEGASLKIDRTVFSAHKF